MTTEIGIGILEKTGMTSLIVGVAVLVGWVLNRYVLKRLVRLALETKWRWDEILLSSVKRLTPFWSLLLGLYFSLRLWGLSEQNELFATNVLIAILILSLTYFLVGASSQFITVVGQTTEHALAAATLTRNLVTITIIVIGVLIILAHLGVSIAPMLTAVGVGGIAIALGLQETLSNLFAGVYITWAGQIRMSDYVRLDTGEEGYISDISWRETRIRTLQNNMVTIPNGRLAKAIITNYDLPEKEISVRLDMGVDYSSNLDHVERVTLEVAKDVMKNHPLGVPNFDPVLRYKDFGSSSIDFVLLCRANEYASQYALKSDLIKRIHAQYLKEGIIIPFPIRTLITKN